MRFLVDAQLPPALARWLAAQGHETAHIGDLADAGGVRRRGLGSRDSARDNLVEIAQYIAAVSGEDSAVRFTGEIVDKCEHLATLTGLRSLALILRSPAEPGVSKDGRLRDRRLRPSFETHRFRDAPRQKLSG